MRVSTNMIYDRGVGSIQQQWKSILHTQQQVASGRRVLTPADDPIAAARALEIGQSKAVNSQFSVNTGYADDALKLLDSRLGSAGDVLHYVRERAVQAGNGALAAEDLRYMATDMKAQFDAMLALANSQDGVGEYIFGGYRSQQQPYSGGLAGVEYKGDQGERTIQVSASRYMPISLPGSGVFDKTLVLGMESVNMFGALSNKGEMNPGPSKPFAVSAVDAQSVRQATRYQIEYKQRDPANLSVADPASPRKEYVVQRLGVDGKAVPWTNDDLIALGWSNGATPPGLALPTGYSLSTDRTTITLNLDPTLHIPGTPPTTLNIDGLTIDIPDDPVPNPVDAPQGARLTKDEMVDGDRFEIFVPLTNLLNNMAMFASALEKPGVSGMTGAVAFALETFDAGQENLLKVRAQIGSQLTETEALTSLGGDLDLQYAATLSGLQDVDYADAISRLTQQQTYLQAAQQSFMRVSGLSLFNYLS